MKSKPNMFEVPFHENLMIDKSGNIYLVDAAKKVLNSVKFETMIFMVDKKILCTLNLYNLTFYGVEYRSFYSAPRIILPELVELHGEIFKRIPRLPEGYFISASGAVYSSRCNSTIKKHEIDEDGYHRISISNPPGMTHMAVHRLVYESWVGPIPEGYVIDHIDNKKWNNYYENLQAITPEENSRKAAQDGFYNTTFHWNEKNVEEVCRLMSENVTIKEIEEKFGIDSSDKTRYKNFRNQLYQLRKGSESRSWRDVASKYDLSSYDGNLRPDSKFRDSEIIRMRDMYAKGKTCQEIAKELNIGYSDYLRMLILGKKRKKIKL